MWFYFTILAAVLWATATVIDEYVIDKFINNPLVNTLLYGIIGLFAGILVFVRHGPFPLTAIELALCLFSGIAYTVTISMYFIALKREEVTRVVPLFSLGVIFTLIFANIFLNEYFTPVVYLGIFLILIGSVLISIKITKHQKNLRLFKMSEAAILMAIGGIFSGISAVIQKYLIETGIHSDFVFGYSRIGVAIPAVFIFFFVSKEIKRLVYEKKKHVFAIMLGSETITIIATFFVFVAMSMGPVTLISAVLSAEPMFTLMFAGAIGIFIPKALIQELNRKVILQKTMAILFIVLGMILMAEYL